MDSPEDSSVAPPVRTQAEAALDVLPKLLESHNVLRDVLLKIAAMQVERDPNKCRFKLGIAINLARQTLGIKA